MNESPKIISATPAPPLLFAEDVAKRFDIPVRTARDWLGWLEKQHGVKVVGRAPARRGIRRYTTEAGLLLIGPNGRPAPAPSRERLTEIEDELSAQQRQIDDMQKRLDAVERRT